MKRSTIPDWGPIADIRAICIANMLKLANCRSVDVVPEDDTQRLMVACAARAPKRSVFRLIDRGAWIDHTNARMVVAPVAAKHHRRKQENPDRPNVCTFSACANCRLGKCWRRGRDLDRLWAEQVGVVHQGR